MGDCAPNQQPPFNVGLQFARYAAWIHTAQPSAAEAFAHAFAQALAAAEADGRPVAAFLSIVVDLPYQESVLAANVLPRCLAYDPKTGLLAARNVERWVKGIHLLYKRICQTFPDWAPAHADAQQAYATLYRRFGEIFCCDGE